MKYNRDHPSPRYLALIEEYRELHATGESSLSLPSEITYAGYSTFHNTEAIKNLLMKIPCLTLLDYGSGKGYQYETALPSPHETDSLYTLKEYWQLQSITCYDPAYPPFAQLPENDIDAVICIDVLEHVPMDDLDWVIREIFSKSRKIVFLAVACYPARKMLNDGSNAHCIVESPKWWHHRINTIAQDYSNIVWKLSCVKKKAN